MAEDPALEAELEQLMEQQWFEPPAEFVERALITDMSEHEAAAADPVGWWEKQARALDWATRWEQALDDSKPPFYKWFSGGSLNVSYNCVDRHVEAGNGERVAFHWHGEEGGERTVTYNELLDQVQRAANALKARGIGPGDVVGIYLPMIPEVVVAMLACARIGAPHNVVFGGFSVDSVRERMEFSKAKALITVDGAARKGKTTPIKNEVDATLGELASLQSIFVVRNTGTPFELQEGRDVVWDEALAAADPVCPPEPFDSEHPLFILYSSGSTAQPKGILHTSGGYLTGVSWSFKYVFDIKPASDIFWCSADVGWITGHSYIVYGALANGATSVMYEGAPDYPDKDIWWQLCERYKVTIFYTAPTAIRACMKWGPEYPRRHDLSSLRLLGTVGEPINPKAWAWYWLVIGGGRCPIIDTWWQTETGNMMITTLPGAQAAKPGSAGTALPGITAEVVDNDGKPVERGTQGLLILKGAWPGMLRTLYGDDERYVSTYWERFGPPVYFVGDASREDADGRIWVIGRVDDVINVSGHRLSTAEIESAIVGDVHVAEAAVVGENDELTGQSICAFVTLNSGAQGDDEAADRIRRVVGERIGKFARPKRIIWADDLPKTRSGKIMRRLLRDIAEGRALGDVTTLRDPAVMASLEQQIAELDED